MENVKSVMAGMLFGVRDSVCGTIMVFQLDRAQRKAKAKRRRTTPPEELTILAKRRAIQAEGDGIPKIVKNDEPNVLHRLVQCCVLNGGIFWISILFFNNLVLPALQLLIHLILGSSSGTAGMVWSWLNPFMYYTFSTLWVVPLFLLSKIVNGLWFQDIADSAYRQSRGRPQMLNGISKLIADTLFSIGIQFLFLVQSFLVGLLPIAMIGWLANLLHMCLLYSLYAFEYKWINMGWELHKRLSFIENNWPYFVGFGLPLAMLTSLPSSRFISACVFSILFPLFIISGNAAEPITGSCDYSLQLFSPVVYLSNIVFKYVRMWGSKSNIPKLPASAAAMRQRSENAYRR